MVFTIGNHDDSLPHAFLLGEAVDGHIDSSGNISALRGNHVRRDAAQEHLGTDIVAGNRQLDKGIACKDYESYLVIGKVVDKILNHHLRTVQTTGSHIFG